MPKKTNKKAAAEPAEAATLNKAKAAFEEYKNRMAVGVNKPGSMKAAQVSQPPINPFMNMSQPQMPVNSQGMMGAPIGMMGGMMQQLFMQNLPFSPSLKQPDGQFFSSIGNMIRLGMDVVNAGLAGGLQLMGGLSNYGGMRCDSSHGHNHSCCEPSCCSGHGHSSCCCEPRGYEPCGCNPGVHNCC